jgi:hypothetical protein
MPGVENVWSGLRGSALSGWASEGGPGRKNRHGHVLRARPLAESSQDHRLSALSNFYTLPNGRRGYTPCLEVDRFKEPDRKINAHRLLMGEEDHGGVAGW